MLGLAGGIVLLPWLQTLEWDFDRSGMLAIVPVAVIAGRAVVARALDELSRASVLLRACAAVSVVAALLATALSPHPAASVVQLAGWVMFALAAILAGRLVAEDPRRGELLLGALALSGAVGALAHWTRWKLGAPPDMAFYPHHRLMGLHALGSALAATSMAATAQRFASLWVAVGVVAWGGLFWTGSRSPLVGIAAALIVWAFRATPAVRRRLMLCTGLSAAGGLALSAALDPGYPALGWKNLVVRTVQAESAQQLTSHRSDFWAGAWQQVQASPWLGYGPDAYRFLEPKLEGNQPHNAFLQWLLDLGVFGALAAAALVGWALWRAWRNVPAANATAGWSALAIASFVAGQFDGYFYHSAALLTTALAFGIVCFAPISAISNTAPLAEPASGTASAGGSATSSGSLTTRAWPVIAATATVILVAHTWLFQQVARARPPQPHDFAARVWQRFPSTTLGVDRWIDAWEKTDAGAALAAAELAARQSPTGDYYRVKTAGILLRRGDEPAARKELEYAVAIAPPTLRPVIAALRDQLLAKKPHP